MYRKMHTSIRCQCVAARTSLPDTGRWLALSVLLLAIMMVALLMTAPQASAAQDSTLTSVTATTDRLPSDFADTLNAAGLTLVGTETLSGLGLVIVELHVATGQTPDAVFGRLVAAFPGHRFERFEDTLDFETSAY